MRTLVLNAGYEPLAVVSFRRALVLVLAGKATVIADGGNPVVGGTLTLPRPSGDAEVIADAAVELVGRLDHSRRVRLLGVRGEMTPRGGP